MIPFHPIGFWQLGAPKEKSRKRNSGTIPKFQDYEGKILKLMGCSFRDDRLITVVIVSFRSVDLTTIMPRTLLCETHNITYIRFNARVLGRQTRSNDEVFIIKHQNPSSSSYIVYVIISVIIYVMPDKWSINNNN